MSALIYIIQSLLTLALFVVLLRLLLQWARADFRNPICQAIVRLTNPLIVPLRRVLPPIGKVDTASVVAVILVAIVEMVIVMSLAGFPWIRCSWCARRRWRSRARRCGCISTPSFSMRCSRWSHPVVTRRCTRC